MYVTPFSTKTLVNSTVNGELRASILQVEDDTLGLINVGNSINSLNNDKQTKITENDYLTISDVVGLTDELSSVNLSSSSDITTGTIDSGNITGRVGTTIRAPNVIATESLFYGPITNLVNVEDEIEELESDIASNTIDSTKDIICNDITCEDLTVDGVFNMADMITSDTAVRAAPQFDTIFIRRPTGMTAFSGKYVINLRELQVCVNDLNILQHQLIAPQSMFTLWTSPNKQEDEGYFRDFSPDKLYNNDIKTLVGAMSIEKALDPHLALIIRSLSLYSINDIQSIILYNRPDSPWIQRATGF